MAPSRGVAGNLVLAVDEALLVPGEIVRTAIYERVERSYQIRRGEIPEKLETFHRALQELLGVDGKIMAGRLSMAVNHAKRSEVNGSREG